MPPDTQQNTQTEDDSLAGLSPEELAALNDGEEAENLDDIINDGEAADGADVAAGAEKDDTTAGDDAQGEEAAPNAEDTQAAETSAEVETKRERPDFIPRMDDSPVENYDQKMAEFKNQRDELVGKLDNGDIDLAEYVKQDRELGEKQTSMQLQQRDALNAAKYNLDVATQRWGWVQEQFFTNEANKVYATDEKLHGELNKMVKLLASDKDNGDKDSEWFLTEADAIVRARYASSFGAAKTTTNADDKVKEPEKKPAVNRDPKLDEIPKTLGSMPNAQINEDDAGEFAYLNGLTGLELEHALAAIAKDPAKEARYLRS